MIQLGAILAVDVAVPREDLVAWSPGCRTIPTARRFALIVVVGVPPGRAWPALCSPTSSKAVLYDSPLVIAVAFVARRRW